jgi:hypothetical protein
LTLNNKTVNRTTTTKTKTENNKQTAKKIKNKYKKSSKCNGRRDKTINEEVKTYP